MLREANPADGLTPNKQRRKRTSGEIWRVLTQRRSPVPNQSEPATFQDRSTAHQLHPDEYGPVAHPRLERCEPQGANVAGPQLPIPGVFSAGSLRLAPTRRRTAMQPQSTHLEQNRSKPMSFMACGEDLLCGHVDLPPLAPSFSETLHCCPSSGEIVFLSWNQMCNGLSVTGDYYPLPAFDRPKQLSQLCFSLGCLYFTHVFKLQPVILTGFILPWREID